jgi:hypothetical protein
MLLVFRWEIFNPRTLSLGIEKLRTGPGLVETSFDRDISVKEIEKFIAM